MTPWAVLLAGALQVPCDSLHLADTAFLMQQAPVRAQGLDWFPDANAQGLQLPTAAGTRFVAAFSWEAVGGSVIMLLSCEGTLLSARSQGPVDSLWSQDVLGDSLPEILVRYRSGHGTGWFQASLGILSVARDSLRVVYDGVLIESSSFGDSAQDDTATVSFPRPGQLERLVVTRRSYCAPPVARCLPAGKPSRTREVWTWNPVAGQFARNR
jgi:hypothetical protein